MYESGIQCNRSIIKRLSGRRKKAARREIFVRINGIKRQTENLLYVIKEIGDTGQSIRNDRRVLLLWRVVHGCAVSDGPGDGVGVKLDKMYDIGNRNKTKVVVTDRVGGDAFASDTVICRRSSGRYPRTVFP